ncbi:hypothetical protein LGQ02_18920 [Bacillus shivajii]|uniref:hypothetical protein n=1 Tax=Bacillus shivajii TaxID=1983719 RepID=UPI001CF96381|nr:hypothetical protein [Bacillus shivajii]UCZ52828.1 hypothetical protein LGQ02_18920 [Bacillus shivajii]
MIFGTGMNDDGVTGEQSTFSQYETIYDEISLSSSYGTSTYEVFLLKASAGGGEQLFDRWKEEVDPTWDHSFGIFHEPNYHGILETGDYVVRVFVNDELLTEGTFTIE